MLIAAECLVRESSHAISLHQFGQAPIGPVVGGDGEIVVKVLDGRNLGNSISLARARFRGTSHDAQRGDGDQQGRAEGSSGKETPQGRPEKRSGLPRRTAVPGRPVSVKILEKCGWPGESFQAFLQPRPPGRNIRNPAGGGGDCNNSLPVCIVAPAPCAAPCPKGGASAFCQFALRLCRPWIKWGSRGTWRERGSAAIVSPHPHRRSLFPQTSLQGSNGIAGQGLDHKTSQLADVGFESAEVGSHLPP